MKVELKLEPGLQEPKIVVVAGADTPEIQKLIKELEEYSISPIPVWEGDQSKFFSQADFLRFYAQDKLVLAQTAEGTYTVRLRLYELEQKLNKLNFVRISNGEIINLRRVTAVDLSITGTICMTLDETVKVYVSRRYVKRIKEILKMRKEC